MHQKKHYNLEKLFNNVLSYRLLFIITSIAYLLFHYIFKEIDPNCYDPIWDRIAVSSCIFITYLLSFYVKRVKQNFLTFVYVLSYIITFHYIYLMYMNNMSINYAIGYFTIVPCTTILFNNIKSLTLYTILSFIGILFIFHSLSEPIVNFLMFISILITVDIILFLVVISRISLINSSKTNNYELTKSNLRLSNAIETIKLYNSKLQKQKEQILKQNNQIKEKNKDVTDSINYAQRIQTALLPSSSYIENILDDYFILYKPKDIVSGDFYWIKQKNGKIIVSVADCTGHGVPGAFMSILGITILNEITDKYILDANEILNHLRQDIIDVLYKYSNTLDKRDGMDMALFIIDKKDQTLQFSGANNPLYIVRNKKLIQYKADKMQIGIPSNSLSSFTNQKIKFQKGDSCYIFTDGYIDQFDASNENKFKTKKLQSLLVEISEKPMSEQKNILNNTLENWKGDVEQTDDISFLGIKF